MKNSKQWWDDIKNDDIKVYNWLLRQLRGEIRATREVGKLLENPEYSKHAEKLSQIRDDEAKHAAWIKNILNHLYGSVDECCLGGDSDRYWKEANYEDLGVDETLAIAAHAEGMRLDRISAIADDETAKPIIRDTFKKILKDELNHEKWFKEMTSEVAYESMRERHENGLTVLGLES